MGLIVAAQPAWAADKGSATMAVSQGKQGSTLKWSAAATEDRYPVKQVTAIESRGPRLAQATPGGAYTPPGGANTPPRNAMSAPFDLPTPPTLTPPPLRETPEVEPPSPLPTPLPSVLPEMPGTLPGIATPRETTPLPPPPSSSTPLPPAPDPGYSRPGGMGELTPLPGGRAGPNEIRRQCPSKNDKEFADFFKTIKDLSTDIAAKDGEFPKECELGHDTFEPRCWTSTNFMWKASGLCHKPLYFEDSHLERYGHSIFPHLQPVISGASFFLTLPILPYKMGLEPPMECIYTLGYYRPGDCAPHMLDPIPLSVRAGLFQAGAMVGAAAIIP